MSARFFAMAVFETAAGPLAGTRDAALRADVDRAAGLRRDLPRGAASHDPVAACAGRRVPGGGAVRAGEVGHRPVPGQLRLLPEDLRPLAFVPIFLLWIYLGWVVDPARRVVRVVDVGVPLPAGARCACRSATRSTACCACSAASTKRARDGKGLHSDEIQRMEPMLTDALVQQMLAQLDEIDLLAPRRDRRMAARARPRRPHARRTLRSLPPAHPDRRSAPAVPRRRAGRGRASPRSTNCACRCANC